MLTYKEKLQAMVQEQGLAIYEILPSSAPNDGLYIGTSQAAIILMKPHLPDSRYIPVLAEEIGHHFKTQGIVVEQQHLTHIKSENYGKVWAVEFLLPVCKFAFAATLQNCSTPADFASAFSLDLTFVQEAIQHHKSKNQWPQSFEPMFDLLAKPNYQSILRTQRLALGTA